MNTCAGQDEYDKKVGRVWVQLSKRSLGKLFNRQVVVVPVRLQVAPGKTKAGGKVEIIPEGYDEFL